MGNLIRVSRKDFSDLLGSPMTLIVLSGFFIMLSFSFILMNQAVPSVIATGIGMRMEHVDSFGMFFAEWLLTDLVTFFGPILGVVIGCSAIASERHMNALNTLLSKPLYRDTIINGKIVGSLAFLALVILCTMAFYTSVVLVLYGNLMAPTLSDYLSRLPLVFLYAMTIIAIYVTISMLISLLVKKQAFALVIGTLVLYVFQSIGTTSFVDPVSNLFPENSLMIRDLINSLTPSSTSIHFLSIENYLFNSSYEILDSLQLVLPDLARFWLYSALAIIFSYIIFIRRDEA
jgi:ABC-2 type transport system permease protein